MQKVIDSFKNTKHIAIAGVSRTTKGKWGNALMAELTKLGKNVFPINPHTISIDGIKCYNTIKDLPAEVESLIIATKPEATLQLVTDAKEAGIKRVWMQRGAGKGSATPEAIEFCKKNNLEYIYGLCPMMIFGKGGHKFHFWVRKTIGRLPEELKN